MSDSNSTPASRKFSAFWPLLILLITILALQIQGLFRVYDQRKQFENNLKQLAQVETEAKKVDVALGAISRDLLDLAEKNTNAQRVVADFQIRQNQTNSTSK